MNRRNVEALAQVVLWSQPELVGCQAQRAAARDVVELVVEHRTRPLYSTIEIPETEVLRAEPAAIADLIRREAAAAVLECRGTCVRGWARERGWSWPRLPEAPTEEQLDQSSAALGFLTVALLKELEARPDRAEWAERLALQLMERVPRLRR